MALTHWCQWISNLFSRSLWLNQILRSLFLVQSISPVDLGFPFSWGSDFLTGRGSGPDPGTATAAAVATAEMSLSSFAFLVNCGSKDERLFRAVFFNWLKLWKKLRTLTKSLEKWEDEQSREITPTFLRHFQRCSKSLSKDGWVMGLNWWYSGQRPCLLLW